MIKSYAKFAEFYDLLGWSDFSRAVYPQLLSFFRTLQSKPKSFLDLACGTGTLAMKLAESGIEVRGLDISPEMIDSAKAKVSPDDDNPGFVVANMTDFDLGRKFDMVGCFFDSLNHLSTPDLIRKTFKTAHNHLNLRSWFVFDILTCDGLRDWKPYNHTKTNLYFVNQKSRYDEKNKTAHIKIEAFVKDQSGENLHVVENLTEICITENQLKQFLQRSGFVKYIIKSFNPNEPIEEAERLLVFART